ncbi:MAG: nickel-dependent hydrogenase large subunit [Candidatus Aenigmarchaeota archaeon]|nr:nickel-dependent hydrogenase large subunit [Candidatus Aenigmarchaeota archaeon]
MNEFYIPFGPQHPALIEPVHIKLKVDGEKIVDSELVLGYNHKGIEKSFENRWWAKGMYLSERVCGICGHYHTSCFAQGVENLLDLEIPERAKYIRVIIGEIERIHSHMLALGIVAYELGLDTLFHYIFRDRELAMETQELLTGNRVHFVMNVIGGVRKDIETKYFNLVEKNMERLDNRLHEYLKIFKTDTAIRKRITHIGYLSRRKAKELTPVGPNIRASGIKYDVRESGYLVYDNLGFKAVTGEGGDVLERCVVRIKECLESVRLIEDALVKIPKGEISKSVPLLLKIPEGRETVSRVEAPRGELIYYLKSAGDKPYRVKIRTPTYQTFTIINEILRGYEIPDVPVIIASLDPCLSCTDRLTIVDLNTERERVVSGDDIRRRETL